MTIITLTGWGQGATRAGSNPVSLEDLEALLAAQFGLTEGRQRVGRGRGIPALRRGLSSHVISDSSDAIIASHP